MSIRATEILIAHVWEDSSLVVMARIRNQAGQYITQVSLQTIDCSVYDMDNNKALVSNPTITISTTVFDTLQTSVRWTKDTVGYNFLHTLPASSFPLGPRTYRVEYKFTPTSGDPFFLVSLVYVHEIIAS
jgi:hypothetical protein